MTISCSEKFERQINLKLKFFDTAMDDYQSAVREYYEDNTRPVPCDFCNRFCKAKTDGEGLVLIKPNNKEDLKEYYKCNRDYVKSVMLNEKRLESIRKLKIFISTCKPVFPSGSSVGGALPNYLPANIRSNLVWQETIKTVTDVIIKQEVTREYYLEEIPLPNFYG
ncbi:hypothetical protein EBZ38_16935, partial [bacterium]|nr:hypothetical protein [bacterium]